MKSILSLTIIFLSLSFTMQKKKADQCSVKYNGIYAYKLDAENSAVIRFYEDGTVLASTSVNDYMDVFSWFHKENKDLVLKGTYKIKKCDLRFEVKGMTGEQKYNGTISGESITMKLTDKGSKKSATRTYNFVAL